MKTGALLLALAGSATSRRRDSDRVHYTWSYTIRGGSSF